MGLQIGAQPPLRALRAFLLGARAMRLDSVMVVDHFQNFFPSVIWDRELTWLGGSAQARMSSSTIRFCSAISRPASGACAWASG